MARLLFPDRPSVERVQATVGTPVLNTSGAELKVYLNEAGTSLANDLQDAALTPVTNGTFVVTNNSEMPDFYGPTSGQNRLYGRIDGGTPFPIDARVGGRMDAVEADVAAALAFVRAPEASVIKHHARNLRGVLRAANGSRRQDGAIWTLSAAGAASAIAGSSDVLAVAAGAANRNAFRWTGCSPAPAGGAYPDSTFIRGFGDSQGAEDLGQSVEFKYDGLDFEINVKSFATGNALAIRVWIDDEVVPGTLLDEWNPGPSTSAGGFFRHRIQLPSTWVRKHRRFRLELSGAAYFSGITVEPATTVIPTDLPARGPRVIVIGDSYTEGTIGGAETPAAAGWQSYVAHMARIMGWRDVWANGAGGTGYLASNSIGGGRVKFRDRIVADCLNYNPDIVIISGGHNDTGSAVAAVGTEAGLLFDQILTALGENGSLIVLGPLAQNTGGPANVYAPMSARLKTEAESRGVYYIDPVLEEWITTANVGTYIGADGVHPTSAGHKYFGQMLAAHLRQAGH